MTPRFAELQQLSRRLFAEQAAQTGITETTPPAITDKIRSFADTLRADTPLIVPVITDPYGLFGWCSDGVLEKIRHDGGTIRFGWIIWEMPDVLLTAEFHAVWRDANGKLFDITPKPQHETSIVFAPAPDYPANFDFSQRPNNQRVRIYEPADEATIAAEITSRIARMNRHQRHYETRRATQKGVSLEAWLRTKYPVDILPGLIDEFLVTCERREQLIVPAGDMSEVSHPSEYLRIEAHRAALITRIRSELARRHRSPCDARATR